MGEDNFSGLIRSSKSHSVSVSEHTGNAKTVRNRVTSDEQKIEDRKPVFEKQATGDHANIQKVSADSIQIKGQSVSVDYLDINLQQINQGSQTATNVQRVKAESLKDNNQKISAVNIATNLQITDRKNIAQHNQGISQKIAIQDNNQKILNDDISNKKQSVSDVARTSNLQGIGNDKIADNKQDLKQGNINAGDQKVQKGKDISTNFQDVFVDGGLTNRQAIEQSSSAFNNQSLSKVQVPSNKPSIQSLANGKNRQAIPNGMPTTNDAKTDKLDFQDNNQEVVEQVLDGNPQPIENIDASLNLHRTPKEEGVAVNRQPTDKENYKDHLEVLPSKMIERAEVDFGPAALKSSSRSEVTFSKIVVKQQVVPAVMKTALTAQQAAKLKHDKNREAFHGRLAGIKRGVDALNSRLDVMEKRK